MTANEKRNIGNRKKNTTISLIEVNNKRCLPRHLEGGKLS